MGGVLFLKGRGKGACETPNVSTVDSLAAPIWIWISHQPKTKTSALRFCSLVRSPPRRCRRPESSSPEWHMGNLGAPCGTAKKKEASNLCLSGLHTCTVPYTQRGTSHIEQSAHKEQFYMFCLQMTSWWHVQKESLSHVWGFIHAHILKMLFFIVWRVFNRSAGPVQDIAAATLISALTERFAGAHSEW